MFNFSRADDVLAIAMGKLALRYAGEDIEAMKAVAKSSADRSLAKFQQALTRYHKQLHEDPIIRGHLKALMDDMLEKNLCRIIEPYSRVQVCCNFYRPSTVRNLACINSPFFFFRLIESLKLLA